MKKTVIALTLLTLAGALTWWMVQRRPGGPPQDETPASFAIEKAGSGTLLRFQDSRIPLRSFRWVTAKTGPWLAAQILTQNSRQEVVLFKEGSQVADISIPRPAGVSEGFFHFAELREFLVLPGNTLVMLYTSPDAAGGELPMVLTMDLNTQEFRWTHRAAGEHIVAGGSSKDGAVFLFGPKSPITRLPIELQKGEKPSRSGFRTYSKTFEFPPEIQELADLLPTGSWTFLAAHSGGLSAYLGSKGWIHHSALGSGELAFKGFAPSLAQGDKRFWWQPRPGTIVQVLVDGSPVSIWNPECFTILEPWAMDAQMLRLQGSDEDGCLWFSLMAPDLTGSSPQAAPEDSQHQEPPADPSAMEANPMEAWQAHVGKGLSRLYRWKPTQRSLHRLDWSQAWTALKPPASIDIPKGNEGLRPGAGAFVVETNRSLWWLPLKSLPMGKPMQTAKASEPPK